MQIGVKEERPPYVQFETRAVEDRAQSTNAQLAYKNVDYVIITPQGSKDRIERVVDDWFKYLKSQVEQQRFRQDWLQAYKTAYQAWKEDREPPLNGSAITTWPAATPAQVKLLLDLRLRTVEDLAAANEETVNRLGMGGRALVMKAQEWLRSSKDTAPALEELTRLRIDYESMKATNDELRAANQLLQSQLQQFMAANQAAQTSNVMGTKL